ADRSRTPRRRLRACHRPTTPVGPGRRGATLSSSGAVLALAIVGCLAAIGALAILFVVLRRVGMPGSAEAGVPGEGLSPAETARRRAAADSYAADLRTRAERDAAAIVSEAENAVAKTREEAGSEAVAAREEAQAARDEARAAREEAQSAKEEARRLRTD